MNTYTSLAIDAFRKVELAQRRVAKANAELRKAIRHIPAEEFNTYVLETEIVRLEFDQVAAEKARDRETADACRLRIAELRRQAGQEAP